MSKTARARVVNKVSLSSEVCAITFEAIEERFTSLEPGAHLTVHVLDETVRSHSLTEWDEYGRWVSVAVKRERQGRGGSIVMHALQVGDVVRVDGPRNNFPLRTDSNRIVLIGGGIGITPISAMAQVLRSRGREFDAYYVVRNRDQAALDDCLRDLKLGTRYHLHCTEVDGQPDFSQLLEDYPARPISMCAGQNQCSAPSCRRARM